MTNKHFVILLRHGQSTWNAQNRFTGWEDSDLTAIGEGEAKEAGKILRNKNIRVDVAYTSLLRRAIKTLWITLDEINQVWVPVYKCWKLNERHYGHLTGLNKSEMEEKFGADEVKKWRKSYEYLPNPVNMESKQWSGYDDRYHLLSKNEIPFGESLKNTVARVSQFWSEHIISDLKKNKTILISAHGNSLRALIMFLENISPEEIENLDIPRATPIILELDSNLIVNH
jgi:2,3-bisphosphoglycerate-dependent phosphoglycerate mutase